MTKFKDDKKMLSPPTKLQKAAQKVDTKSDTTKGDGPVATPQATWEAASLHLQEFNQA